MREPGGLALPLQQGWCHRLEPWPGGKLHRAENQGEPSPAHPPCHTSALLQPAPNSRAWGVWTQKHFCSWRDAPWALCLPHAPGIWTRTLLQCGNMPGAHPCVLTLPLPLLQTQVGTTLWRWPCWEPPGHEMGRWVPLPRPCHPGVHCLMSHTSRASLRVSDAPRAAPGTLLPARGWIWDSVAGAVTPCCSHTWHQ